MDIVAHTADLGSAPTSDSVVSQEVSYSSRWGDTVTLNWLLDPHPKTEQLSVRLPGAGTVRVDVDKHVDKALKGKTNELADGNKLPRSSGASKP